MQFSSVLSMILLPFMTRTGEGVLSLNWVLNHFLFDFHLFSTQIKVVDTARQRKVYQEVIKEIDKEENEALPQVDVDTNEVIFGTVKFRQRQVKHLTVANTGQVRSNLGSLVISRKLI